MRTPLGWLCRHSRGLLVLLLLGTAVGGLWAWRRPPSARATWQVAERKPWSVSPDGRMLADMLPSENLDGPSSTRFETVRVSDTVTGEGRLWLPTTPAEMYSLHFSP